MGQADAFEKLKTGEIAATILIAGKPAGSMAKLRAQDGFRILPIAYSKPVQNEYLPATLSSEDYPNLIAPGQKVETIAVGAVLIAFNWPKGTDRYRRIQKFVDNFFPEARRIPEGAASSEMERGEPRGRAAGLDALCRRGRMAAQPRQGRGTEREQFNQFLANRREQAASLSSHRSRPAVPGIPAMEPHSGAEANPPGGKSCVRAAFAAGRNVMSAPVQTETNDSSIPTMYAPPWARDEARTAGDAGLAAVDKALNASDEFRRTLPPAAPLQTSRRWREPAPFDGDIAAKHLRERPSLDPATVAPPPLRERGIGRRSGPGRRCGRTCGACGILRGRRGAAAGTQEGRRAQRAAGTADARAGAGRADGPFRGGACGDGGGRAANGDRSRSRNAGAPIACRLLRHLCRRFSDRSTARSWRCCSSAARS